MKLTGILVEDPKSKAFLAYIREFPGVMAQGKNAKEAKEKLDISWENYLKYIEKNHEIEFDENGITNSEDVI